MSIESEARFTIIYQTMTSLSRRNWEVILTFRCCFPLIVLISSTK